MEERFSIKYQVYENGKLQVENRSFEVVENGDCSNYWQFCRDFAL